MRTGLTSLPGRLGELVEQVLEAAGLLVQLVQRPAARLGEPEDLGAQVGGAVGGDGHGHAAVLGDAAATPAPAASTAISTAPSACWIRRSTGPSATIRPRLMISSREQVCCTSESTWVERITVRSFPSSPIRRRISTRWLGSSPSVGSSSTSKSG